MQTALVPLLPPRLPPSCQQSTAQKKCGTLPSADVNSVQRGLKTALAAKRIDEEMYRAWLKPVAEPMLLEAARTGHLEDAKRLAELGTNMMCENSSGFGFCYCTWLAMILVFESKSPWLQVDTTKLGRECL